LANFRLLGDCLLWAVVKKVQKCPNFLGIRFFS
jgi:hypothetical protein